MLGAIGVKPKAWVAEKGCYSVFGACSLKRVLQRHLETRFCILMVTSW